MNRLVAAAAALTMLLGPITSGVLPTGIVMPSVTTPTLYTGPGLAYVIPEIGSTATHVNATDLANGTAKAGGAWTTHGTVSFNNGGVTGISSVGPFSDSNYYSQTSASPANPAAKPFTVVVLSIPNVLNINQTPLSTGTLGTAGYAIEFPSSGGYEGWTGASSTITTTVNNPTTGQLQVSIYGVDSSGTAWAQLNGGTVASSTGTTYTQSAITAMIGRYTGSTGLSFNGQIVEVMVSLTAPSAAAFSNIYAGIVRNILTDSIVANAPIIADAGIWTPYLVAAGVDAGQVTAQTVNATTAANSPLFDAGAGTMVATNYCINPASPSCITSWPSAGTNYWTLTGNILSPTTFANELNVTNIDAGGISFLQTLYGGSVNESGVSSFAGFNNTGLDYTNAAIFNDGGMYEAQNLLLDAGLTAVTVTTPVINGTGANDDTTFATATGGPPIVIGGYVGAPSTYSAIYFLASDGGAGYIPANSTNYAFLGAAVGDVYLGASGVLRLNQGGSDKFDVRSTYNASNQYLYASAGFEVQTGNLLVDATGNVAVAGGEVVAPYLDAGTFAYMRSGYVALNENVAGQVGAGAIDAGGLIFAALGIDVAHGQGITVGAGQPFPMQISDDVAGPGNLPGSFETTNSGGFDTVIGISGAWAIYNDGGILVDSAAPNGDFFTDGGFVTTDGIVGTPPSAAFSVTSTAGLTVPVLGSSTNLAGVISFTGAINSYSAGNTLFTINPGRSFPNGISMSVYPGNTATALLINSTNSYVSTNSGAASFVAASSITTAAVTYKFYYVLLGF